MHRSANAGSDKATYVSLSDAQERYCMSRYSIKKLAEESGTLYQFGKNYQIDLKTFDSYFREHYRVRRK